MGDVKCHRFASVLSSIVHVSRSGVSDEAMAFLHTNAGGHDNRDGRSHSARDCGV